MRNILLIIKREYLSRVRKRSFFILSLLGPVFMASLFIVPVYLTKLQLEEPRTVGVVDMTGFIHTQIPDTKNYSFEDLGNISLNVAEKVFKQSERYYAILFIPYSETNQQLPSIVTLHSDREPSMILQEHIKNSLERFSRLEKAKISVTSIDDVHIIDKTKISLTVENWGKKQTKESFYTIKVGLSFFFVILIFMFIYTYGGQVMKGILEDKTNRIVEILVSSVKPYHLLSGKIVGIAFVAVTQFLIWIGLTYLIVMIFHNAFPEFFATEAQQKMGNLSMLSSNIQSQANPDLVEIIEGLWIVNYVKILLVFVYYFLGGYLLYGAFYAAIGAAVDDDIDTQQFSIPIMIPLFIALAMVSTVMENADGVLAQWLSYIPLTSPIIMIVRVIFESVTILELVFSMILMVLGILGSTWVASKIYRTGILMYGKKATYKELWKWIRYKS